jgi:hypothetical protein
MRAERGAVELGVVTIHGGAFTRTPNAVYERYLTVIER